MSDAPRHRHLPDFRAVARLTFIEVKRHASSPRMFVLTPFLLLFILGASWGLSDPNVELPATIVADTPYEVLFLVSMFVLFTATLGVVLVGFDGISRSRLSGVLAIEFSQPISRRDLALSYLLGTWFTVAIPTIVAILVGIVFIHQQMGEWPEMYELFLFLLATALVLLWYSSIQLLASSWAKDMGSAVTLGVGTWLLFTMVWLLVTQIVAAFVGVDATDTTTLEFQKMAALVDLWSPNGVYHLLLETELSSDIARPIRKGLVWFAALLWTLVPICFYTHRFKRLNA